MRNLDKLLEFLKMITAGVIVAVVAVGALLIVMRWFIIALVALYIIAKHWK